MTFGTLLSSQGTDASFETASPVSPDVCPFGSSQAYHRIFGGPKSGPRRSAKDRGPRTAFHGSWDCRPHSRCRAGLRQYSGRQERGKSVLHPSETIRTDPDRSELRLRASRSVIHHQRRASGHTCGISCSYDLRF
ncbi:hypothetical protein D8771_03830 [Streptomyces albus]|uniref:Uncharacterized protein n=1 Tax=Streptomyces albus TaxID=1888 RepID=A0A8H1LM87_9ACTN|nr:hypothetical protein D8771_03830 [Streptomyces albus]